jgi:hypothetical protein
MIKIGFPASFKVTKEVLLGVPRTYWVEFGLEDKSEEDPIKVDFDSTNDLMYITNFKAKPIPDDIIIIFHATTPDNAGESSPLEIRSYTDT